MRGLGVRIPGLLLCAGVWCTSAAATWDWHPVCGPSVNQLVASPHDLDEACAATHGGGVIRTQDGGATWQTISLRDSDALSVVIDPDHPGTYYYGSEGSGAYRTTDGGLTWESKPVSPSRNYVLTLLADPRTPGSLLASTHRAGLFHLRSWDESWLPISPGWMSDDSVLGIAIDAAAKVLYLRCEDLGLTAHIPIRGWQTISTPGRMLRCMATHPALPAGLVVGGGSTHVSFDLLGSSTGKWAEIPGDLTETSVFALAGGTGSGFEFFAGTPGHVARLDSAGAIWESVAVCDARIAVTTIAPSIIDSNLIWAGTPGGGIYRSSDRGEGWQAVTPQLPSGAMLTVAIHPTDDATAYVGAYHGGVYKTIDQGASWQPLPVPVNDWGGVRGLTVDPRQPQILLAALMPEGVWRSEDAGMTWEQIFPAPMHQEVHSLCPTVHIDQELSDRYYVGTYGRGLYVSVDRGQSWRRTNLGDECVWSIAQDPAEPQRLLAATYHGLFLSEDRGENWSLVAPGYSMRTVIFDSVPSGLAFGTSRETGLLLSSDSGVTWERDPTTGGDLENLWGVAVVTSDDERRALVVGTFRKGVAVRPLASPEPQWTWWNEGLPGLLARGLGAAAGANGRLYLALNGAGAATLLPMELPIWGR